MHCIGVIGPPGPVCLSPSDNRTQGPGEVARGSASGLGRRPQHSPTRLATHHHDGTNSNHMQSSQASPREIHPKIHPKQYIRLQGANWVVPPPIRAAPGARATCTAVLVGVFEAYPPLGTTPGVPGRELAAVPEIAINPLDEAFSICIQTGG
jgi:hypothetical protein